MRATIALLAICAIAVHASTPPTKVEFLDVFDRVDGPVGGGWTNFPSAPGLVIFHGAVCAPVQNVGLLSDVYVKGPTNYISYEWYSQTREGFETYAVVASADGTSWIMGCDGGYAQSCTPTIRNLQTGSQVRGTALPLSPTVLYRMEAVVQSTPSAAWPIGMVGMRVHDINGSILFDLSKSLDAPLVSYQLGLLVGRNGYTCATNFLVESAWNFDLAFSDKFDRADGAPGANYVGVNGVPVPQIKSQALCGTTQSVALLATPVSPSSTYRITYDFAAATDQGFESYALAAANITGATPSTYITGCDGGGPGCIPAIKLLTNGTSHPIIEGLSPNLEELATYKFVASYQPGYATFRVYSADGARLLTLIASKLAPAMPFDHLGVLVGRKGDTCITNLEVYTTTHV